MSHKLSFFVSFILNRACADLAVFLSCLLISLLSFSHTINAESRNTMSGLPRFYELLFFFILFIFILFILFIYFYYGGPIVMP